MQNKEKRQPARVLIVESDESVARICQKALQSERFETRWVTSPDAAWAELESWRPQLYILGDEFEDCLALELCGQMRGKTNAPILVLTSTDSVGFQVNCLEAGADDVMVRPIAAPLLLAKAQAHARRAYRYSIPPTAQRARPAQPPMAPSVSAPIAPAATAVPNGVPAPAAAVMQQPVLQIHSPAPVTPEALAPETNFNTWPRCGSCGYMGPNERFEGKNERGDTILCCPACAAIGSIRRPQRSAVTGY